MSAATKSIWWHLGMRFHTAPTVGHGTGKARDCGMCRDIALLAAAWTADAFGIFPLEVPGE